MSSWLMSVLTKLKDTHLSKSSDIFHELLIFVLKRKMQKFNIQHNFERKFKSFLERRVASYGVGETFPAHYDQV